MKKDLIWPADKQNNRRHHQSVFELYQTVCLCVCIQIQFILSCLFCTTHLPHKTFRHEKYSTIILTVCRRHTPYPCIERVCHTAFSGLK